MKKRLFFSVLLMCAPALFAAANNVQDVQKFVQGERERMSALFSDMKRDVYQDRLPAWEARASLEGLLSGIDALRERSDVQKLFTQDQKTKHALYKLEQNIFNFIQTRLPE